MEASPAMSTRESLPLLLTVSETAALLRTTRKAVYVMIERGLLPGVTRIGRRVLVRSTDLLDFLDHNRAPSLQEYKR
jgi:excisionase family DNA binding protein